MYPKTPTFDVALKSTERQWVQKIPEVYTNDLNSVSIQFKITDCTDTELTGSTAIVLLKMRDGSFFQGPSVDVTRTLNVFSYTLKENEGNHDGLAEIQLIVTIDTKKFATQKYNFKVITGLDSEVAREIMIHDWSTLTTEARAYIDEFAANEILRQAGYDADHAQALLDQSNYAVLLEGVTTNDARLEDIKIGADGIIYDSPGNAVRKIGADLNQNIIPLQNEFENGNFKNTGGWWGKTASVSVSENVLKVVPNGIYARILSHTINNLIVGDTYYISLDFKTLKETDAVNFPNFSPVLYFPDNVGMGEFTTISGISEATSSEFRFNMYIPPDATDFSTYEMYVKNAIAINLSKTFSDSNRPTKELLDALVLGSPTIWWGERNAFSQKQLFDLNNLKIDAISNNKLKVMSFNCGTWYDGVTRVPDIEVEEITFYTRKLFGEFDCDFVLGQEFSEYFDVSNTILAIPHVMDFKYEYNTEGSYTPISSSLRCPVISKVPISGTSLTVFSSGDTKRHYVKTYSQINGKNVCFISTLLDKNDTYRLSQMQQLITVMNQEEYVVLGGDFNIKDKVEYAIFTNAGYALANGGVLGWFDTLASYTDEVVRPIDNIIVSPNIRIENVFVDEKRPDDHRAIIAELSF